MPAPVPGQAVLGLNAVTYYNSAYDGTQGSYDAPTWVEASNVQDVTINPLNHLTWFLRVMKTHIQIQGMG